MSTLGSRCWNTQQQARRHPPAGRWPSSFSAATRLQQSLAIPSPLLEEARFPLPELGGLQAAGWPSSSPAGRQESVADTAAETEDHKAFLPEPLLLLATAGHLLTPATSSRWSSAADDNAPHGGEIEIQRSLCRFRRFHSAISAAFRPCRSISPSSPSAPDHAFQDHQLLVKVLLTACPPPPARSFHRLARWNRL